MAVALTNKFRDSCKLYVAGKRDAPRFKRLGDSISLQYQVQKDSPTPIVEGDLVRLDKLVGDICNAVPVILHRPVPKGATIKQVALTIRGPRMFVVFMIDVAAEAQSVSYGRLAEIKRRWTQVQTKVVRRVASYKEVLQLCRSSLIC